MTFQSVPIRSLFDLSRRMINPQALGEEEVFHYSLPAWHEHGSGQVEKAADSASGKLELSGGEILVSKLNPEKQVVIDVAESPLRILCSPEFIALTPSEVFPRFGYYLMLAGPTRTILESSVESVTNSHKRARVDRFLKARVSVPDLPTQKAIADFLDRETARIDQLIEKKQRLVELVRARFENLVTRAVSGLLVKEDDSHLRNHLSGELPEGWSVQRIRDIAFSLQTGPFGSQLHSENYVEGGIPVVNPSHMDSGKIVEDPRIAIDEQTSLRLSRYALATGDVVFARRGELGRCALVTPREHGWLCGTGSIRVRLNSTRMVPEYLVLIMTTSGVRDWLSLESIGSTMDNLNTSMLGRLPIAVPPIEVQKGLLRNLTVEQTQTESLVNLLGTSVRWLEARRSALITSAVTGQIVVHEWRREESIPLGREVVAG